MVNIRDVASWFLSQDSMTHKKLQKLCYYAQAWYCALYDGSPLFEDEIQAWVHGPVVPSLYPVYADYKWIPIPKAEFDAGILEDKVLDVLEARKNRGFRREEFLSLGRPVQHLFHVLQCVNTILKSMSSPRMIKNFQLPA